MKLPNYIADANPLQLAGPPSWFLKQLWEFDSSLAIVPSKQGFYYRLGQRRPLLLKEQVINDVLKEQLDTAMLARHGLVPVTTILATANWSNPLFFEELRRRAPWRMGGWKKYEQMVLDQDKKDRMDRQTQVDERNTYLAKDAWRYYNKKIGTRSHLWSPTVKGSKAASQTPALSIPSSIKSYKPGAGTIWVPDSTSSKS